MFLPLRDENPTRQRPLVNNTLIIVNVLVFLYVLVLPAERQGGLAVSLGVIPERLLADTSGESMTVLTGMFMHGSVSHLLFNMWSLYIFGDNIEDALGRWRYLGFYLFCGLIATVCQVATNPTSSVPIIGASGAIGGVVGAYLVFYPRAPVVTLNAIPLLWFFIGIMPVVPAWVIAAEFFFANLWNGLGALHGVGGGVAYFAHLGGFAAGFLYGRAWRTRHTVHTLAWDGWNQPTRRRRSKRPNNWH